LGTETVRACLPPRNLVAIWKFFFFDFQKQRIVTIAAVQLKIVICAQYLPNRYLYP
jgi:hypothetical protein